MGRICAFTHCGSSTYNIERWKAKFCDTHHCAHGNEECTCSPPFFLIPFPSHAKYPSDKLKWETIINRKDVKTGKNWRANAKNDRICSKHFVCAKPTSEHPHPSVDLGYKEDCVTPKRKAPMQRNSEQKIKRQRTGISEVGESGHDHEYASKSDCPECTDKDKKLKELEHRIEELNEKETQDTKPQRRSKQLNFTDYLLKNDETVSAYTGLPSKAVFNALYLHLLPKAMKMRYWMGTQKVTSTKVKRKFKKTPQKSGPRRKTSPLDELALTLMKIRMGLTNMFIGHLFGATTAGASQIINTWIKFLSKELAPLIFWPDKETVQLMMPPSLRSFRNLRCTIDCSEIFIQRPRNLEIQALTWSDYKKHNTVKYLVAIAPNGMISFLSKAWGGRTSDRVITQESGFLDLIENYDLVLADRGFTISDLLLVKLATLEIPPASGGFEQMTRNNVIKTKKVANGRIHVERAIGRMKWFAILKQVLPISMVPLIDDILTVTAALSNLRKPLVY